MTEQMYHKHAEVSFIKHVDAFRAKPIHRAKTEITSISKIYDNEISSLTNNHDVLPDGLFAELPHCADIKTNCTDSVTRTCAKWMEEIS